MNRGVAWGRIGLLLLGTLPGLVLLVVGPLPDAVSNADALRIAATVLSILTGFLIATVTLAGDPKSLLPGSWRLASAHRDEVKRLLDRFSTLFYVYLGTIVVIFCAALMGGYLPKCYGSWLAHIGLCLGITSLLWSFALPSAIRRMQIERLDTEVEERRRADVDQDVRSAAEQQPAEGSG